MYLTFPLPLSLGCESVYECVDLKMTRARLILTPLHRRSMPACRRIFRCSLLVNRRCNQKEIAWADYEVCFEPQDGLKEKLESFFNQDEIKVIKKTKKGEKEIDLKPHFSLLSMEEKDGVLTAMMRFATGIELNINPTLLLDNAPFELRVQSLKRLMVYNKELKSFC